MALFASCLPKPFSPPPPPPPLVLVVKRKTQKTLLPLSIFLSNTPILTLLPITYHFDLVFCCFFFWIRGSKIFGTFCLQLMIRKIHVVGNFVFFLKQLLIRHVCNRFYCRNKAKGNLISCILSWGIVFLSYFLFVCHSIGNCIYFFFLSSPQKGQQLNVIIWYPNQQPKARKCFCWVFDENYDDSFLLENKLVNRIRRIHLACNNFELFFLTKLFLSVEYHKTATIFFYFTKSLQAQNTRMFMSFFNLFLGLFDQSFLFSSCCLCNEAPFKPFRIFLHRDEEWKFLCGGNLGKTDF